MDTRFGKLSIICLALQVCLVPKVFADSAEIRFRAVHERCDKIKTELTGSNLYVRYAKRPRYYSTGHYWLIRWQKNYIPVPVKDYRHLVVFRYHDSVSGLVSSPGFVMIARDGTAVAGVHYLKTIRFVYTNGMAFVKSLPQRLRTHPVVRSLYHPEASVASQQKIFKYTPDTLDCQRLGKVRKTWLIGMLMAKDAYSTGSLLAAYRKVGSFGGWVSYEKSSPEGSAQTYYIWNGYFSRLFSAKVVSNARIYLRTEQGARNLGLRMGYYNHGAYRNRPAWLGALERLFEKDSHRKRRMLESLLRQQKFETLSF